MKIRKIFVILSAITAIAITGACAVKTPDTVSGQKAETTVNGITSVSEQIEEPSAQINTTEEATVTTAVTDAKVTEESPSSEFPSKDGMPYFDNCAFLGNSRFVAVKDSGLAKNVYPVVGLDVRTAFTKHVTDSDVIILDELNGKDFDKIILMFGENECGWTNVDYFIEKYADVITAVQERVPDAEIYLHAIIPVSAKASAKNECGCNNETIAMRNARIKQFANDVGVKYIEQPPCLMDSEGNLIAEAASDGIHLNRKNTVIWLNYLEEVLY